MSKNSNLPNPWWPPTYPSSAYVIATTSGTFNYSYSVNAVNGLFVIGSNYVKEGASGFCPSYCWHSQIYVNGVLNTEADVDRATPVTATFFVNGWTVYWTP